MGWFQGTNAGIFPAAKLKSGLVSQEAVTFTGRNMFEALRLYELMVSGVGWEAWEGV